MFVMSLPETLTIAEIVQKAKAAGFSTTADAVSQTRRRAKERAAKAAKAAKRTTAKKTAAAPEKAAPETAKKPSVPPPPAEKKTATVAAPETAKRPTMPPPSTDKKTATVAAPEAAKRPTMPPPPAEKKARTVPPPKAEKPSAQTGLSKSDFIRSQPVDLPVAEVVAKAKAAGIKLRDHLVHEVRRADRMRSAAKRASTKKPVPAPKLPAPAAKKPASKKPAPPAKDAKKAAATSPISKSDWIRAQPPSLTAAEVVAKAKGAGIKIEPVLVYKVHGRAKAAKPIEAKAVAKPAAVAPITPKLAAVVAPVAPKLETAPTPAGPGTLAGRTTVEDLLKAVASEIGLRRAIGLLEEQRARVLSVIGG
jgi:hypothetical protein